MLTEEDISASLSDLGPTEDGNYAFTVCKLSSLELTDISAISKFQHIVTLDLSRNNLSDVSPLASLRNLCHLNLSHNHLSSIPDIPLPNLVCLDLSHNSIATITPLLLPRCFPNLVALSLSSNLIADITPLSLQLLHNLQFLSLAYNNLSAFPAPNEIPIHFPRAGVSPAATLESQPGTQLLPTTPSTTQPVSGSSYLTPSLLRLDASRNGLVDVSGLSQCPNLELLDLSNNELMSIECIASMPRLVALDIQQNNIHSESELLVLSSCPNLRSLNLAGNPVAQPCTYGGDTEQTIHDSDAIPDDIVPDNLHRGQRIKHGGDNATTPSLIDREAGSPLASGTQSKSLGPSEAKSDAEESVSTFSPAAAARRIRSIVIRLVPSLLYVDGEPVTPSDKTKILVYREGDITDEDDKINTYFLQKKQGVNSET